MSYDELVRKVLERVKPGDTWYSPRGGRKEIRLLDSNGKLRYYQGPNKASISLPLTEVYEILRTFSGKEISSTDLRRTMPRIFDSKKSGHSCNCYAFFRLLKEIGLVANINGEGIRGNPYRVEVP